MGVYRLEIESFLGILEAYATLKEEGQSGKLAYQLACQCFNPADVTATFRHLVKAGTMAISADWLDYSGVETESMATIL